MKNNYINCSILMSVYSKEKPEYLEACMQSLARQTVKADELVLVEDGPISEEMVLIIDRFRLQLKINSVRLEKNIGLAGALNIGLNHCTHELIIRMDTDDIALPDRIKRQVEFMKANPEITASSGYIEEFNDEGKILSCRAFPLKHNELIRFSKQRSPLSHPAVIFRKNAIISVGGYPDVYPEDYFLWIILISKGYIIGNISDVLVRMRIGDAILTRRGLKMLKGEIKIHKFMLDNNLINIFEYYKIVALKIFIRMLPGRIKLYLYKIARPFVFRVDIDSQNS
jgi:glycosyltransferase involved in cell wall biosynthesis